MTELLKGQWSHRRLVLEVLMDSSQSKSVCRNLRLLHSIIASVPSRSPILKSILRLQEFLLMLPGFWVLFNYLLKRCFSLKNDTAGL